MNSDRCNINTELRDYGGKPLVVNIDRLARLNQNYRTALWTGRCLQVTLMSIRAGRDIGLEMHPDVDQLIFVESGRGVVHMGCCRDSLTVQRYIDNKYAVMIPAGTWHNIINTGGAPLKLCSVYAPPQHPFGTVHETRKEAERFERH